LSSPYQLHFEEKTGMPKVFTVMVEKDPERSWLVEKGVEPAGCYTQTPDLPALAANIEEAITGYLKSPDLS
jgi:predicted RNase H-like HicB family nuclease